MINVCLVGYGYWGKNLLRNLTSLEECRVACVCELNKNAHRAIKALYPGLNVVSDYTKVLADTSIDAVILATPTGTHFSLASEALQKGKHVLIEKPFTTSVGKALVLIEMAEAKNKVLMIDHTFLYSGAVEKVKELIDSRVLGELKYFDSTRINLGLIQPDVNVLWDLAPHDLSILCHIHSELPTSITATGVSHLKNGIENIAYLTINYDSGFIAHLNCSWSSPVKVRTTLIGGDKKMIVYDDINPTDKIRVYDCGFDIKPEEDKSKILVDYRTGDIHIPKLDTHEPLRKMLQDFLNSINTKSAPVSNWNIGLNTVRILEAAQVSIKENSQQISI